jgi:hypothetical protein
VLILGSLSHKQVSSATEVVPISYGQAAEYKNYALQAASVVSANQFDPTPDAAKDSFFLSRVPSRLKSACSCRTSVNDVERNDPIYVDPGSHAGVLDDQITPSHEVFLSPSMAHPP